MVPFKEVFLGQESRAYPRAMSSQCCVPGGGKHNNLEVATLNRPPQDPQYTAEHCVHKHGFSFHADVRCTAHQRNQLERLCRYITRPAIAHERLKRNRAGDIVLQLKGPYQDGTTHIVMSPLEFMQRLAALVRRSRLNLIRIDEIPPCISPFGSLARKKSINHCRSSALAFIGRK